MAKAWHVPTLRGLMGDWIYYPALLTAEQIANHVQPVKDIREAKLLDDHLQRDLKPRVSKIVRYLTTRETRFFGAIIIGVFDAIPGWVEFDLTDVVSANDMDDSEEVEEIQSSMGILVFDGFEKMFALDGQHRIAGITEAYEKKAKGVLEDQYPVIFVAHVDDAVGKIRTRRLFSDINKNAVPVSGGDKVIIDEDDPIAIVTRRVFAEYKPFRKGKEIALTERTEVLIDEKGVEYFTSLLSLFTVCKKLKPLYKKEPRTDAIAEENIAKYQKIVQDFFDFMILNEPSFKGYFKDKTLTLKGERTKNKNLFFKPVGLELLARTYVHYASADRLGDLKKVLAKAKFDNPGGVFDGLLWKQEKIDLKAKTLALKLLFYVSGELSKPQEAELQKEIRKYTDNSDYKLPSKLAI